MGKGQGRMEEKVQGIRSINGRYKIDRGRLRNSIGNGEAKELVRMIHGHELSGEGVLEDMGEKFNLSYLLFIG